VVTREIGAKLIPVEVLFVGEDEAMLADQHCHVSEPSRMASNDGDLFQGTEIEMKSFRVAGRRIWAVKPLSMARFHACAFASYDVCLARKVSWLRSVTSGNLR
jgi:hypothetical protein